LDDFRRAGAEFVVGVRIGKDRTIDSLLQDGFDAVFLGVGSGVDADMEIPGDDMAGVYPATEFLVRSNASPDKLPPELKTRPSIGKRLVVIGGGDTASDCLRSALRMGALEVTCLYRRTEAEMPGGKKDRELARQAPTIVS
jgi:glutamate synthase (NADPH/NADH) small chain